MKKYLVFDAGGTFIKYGLLDENAQIIEKGKVSTAKNKKESLEGFLEILDPIVETYKAKISGIAVSVPGILDSTKGDCMTGGSLTYFCGVSLVKELERRYGLSVAIENDGKCAALAERWKGSLKDCVNGAVVILGTGVGGGLIINGQLYRGTHFTAGEYSYIMTMDKGMHDMNAFWGMKNGSVMLAKNVSVYTEEDWESYDGIKIFARANGGDEAVLKGIKDFTDALAVQIYNLNIVLDLDVIAIGGGISRQPLLFEYLGESMIGYLQNHPIKELCPYIPTPNITNCVFYNDANLIGALYHYLEIERNSKGGDFYAISR